MHVFKGVLLATSLAVLSWQAAAQDYGLTVGFHETSATVDSSSIGASGSVNGQVGYALGFSAAFDLIPDLKFRSGLLYDARPFQYKVNLPGGSQNINFNFAYIDVPIDLQYNFVPMFGIFAGLVVGINVNNSVSTPSGISYSPSVTSLYPLANAGFNFTFDNLIGFDLFYEYGIGQIADYAKNYNSFGLRFIYWL